MAGHENDRLATVQGWTRRGRLQEQVTTRMANMLAITCHSSAFAVMLEVGMRNKGFPEGFQWLL